MKNFLSKSILGIALLSCATAVSCKKYDDLGKDTTMKLDDKDEGKKETSTELNTETETVEEVKVEVKVDPTIYSRDRRPDVYLYGQVGQKKQLTPIFDGNAVDPSACVWSIDHPDYMSINSLGIVQANTDLEAVKASRQRRYDELRQKVLSGEIVQENLTQGELDYLNYESGFTEAIVTAALKSDTTKQHHFKIEGNYDKFQTRYANEGNDEVVIHTVPFGQDSTITYNMETEVIGNHTYYDNDLQPYYVENIYKTHLVFIENHLNPIEDLLVDCAARGDDDVTASNYVRISCHDDYHQVAENYYAQEYSSGDFIRIEACASARTFTMEIENTLCHNGQFDFYERLGNKFTITVNVVA